METNVTSVSQNQGYWFVLRDEHQNVLFSSNNIPLQNPQAVETRYIIEPTDNRQYIQINEPVIEPEHEVLQTEKLNKVDDLWERSKVKLLLSLCHQHKLHINPNSKEKSMWDTIAPLIGNSPEECCKKYKNLRRTYVRLLKKKLEGKDVKWVYYNLCHEVFKDCKSLAPSVLNVWQDHKIRRLLSLYIENLDRFRNSDCLKMDIWKEIAALLGTSEYSCYHKFKYLKRTYFNWLQRNRETGRLIKWPYHQYFERIFYNFNPSVGPWTRDKVKQLLDAYTQISYKFRNPKFQKRELWREIGKAIGISATNCDRKFRNMKQTYIKVKLKDINGRHVTKWRYYKDFEAIYSMNQEDCIIRDVPISIAKFQEEDYIRDLLTFYIENKEKFKNPTIKNKPLWKSIAPKIGLTWEECDKKFRNLKQTYNRLCEKKKESGLCTNWPYYSYFELIFDEDDESPKRKENGYKSESDDLTLAEIKNLTSGMQERRDRDRKFERLIQLAEESNNIQRERNRILQGLLDRK